jgi:hypothetical protein
MVEVWKLATTVPFPAGTVTVVLRSVPTSGSDELSRIVTGTSARVGTPDEPASDTKIAA